eukprot:jgi/Bigna1/71638/fgenesh1_pg.16_\
MATFSHQNLELHSYSQILTLITWAIDHRNVAGNRARRAVANSTISSEIDYEIGKLVLKSGPPDDVDASEKKVKSKREKEQKVHLNFDNHKLTVKQKANASPYSADVSSTTIRVVCDGEDMDILDYITGDISKIKVFQRKNTTSKKRVQIILTGASDKLGKFVRAAGNFVRESKKLMQQ